MIRYIHYKILFIYLNVSVIVWYLEGYKTRNSTTLGGYMNLKSADRMIIMLIASVILLLVVNVSLFIRVNQLQAQFNKIFGNIKPVESIKVGEHAPEFTLLDSEGQEITLTQFSGKRVMLVFSDVSCPHCQQFWPTLNKFHNSYPDLNILMISNGTTEENSIMKREQSFNFPVLGWDETVAEKYKVPGTPYLILLSTKQNVDLTGYADDLQQVIKIISK